MIRMFKKDRMWQVHIDRYRAIFSHLDDAIAAVDITLTPDEINRLESPYLPHAVVGLAGTLPVGGKLTLKDAE